MTKTRPDSDSTTIPASPWHGVMVMMMRRFITILLASFYFLWHALFSKGKAFECNVVLNLFQIMYYRGE